MYIPDGLGGGPGNGDCETDPTLDVMGLDTRNKLLLIANQVFGKTAGIDDVSVKGITHLAGEDIEQTAKTGKILKLVGTGTCVNGRLTLAVEPTLLEPDHPLAGINYSEKGISYLTDIMGRITVTGGQSSPVGAAAALLKDLIHSSLLA